MLGLSKAINTFVNFKHDNTDNNNKNEQLTAVCVVTETATAKEKLLGNLATIESKIAELKAQLNNSNDDSSLTEDLQFYKDERTKTRNKIQKLN